MPSKNLKISDLGEKKLIKRLLEKSQKYPFKSIFLIIYHLKAEVMMQHSWTLEKLFSSNFWLTNSVNSLSRQMTPDK